MSSVGVPGFPRLVIIDPFINPPWESATILKHVVQVELQFLLLMVFTCFMSGVSSENYFPFVVE